MTTKECGHYDDDPPKSRRLLGALLAFIVLILFIIFLVWIILRPAKPRFMLQDATVYTFNVSQPNLLTTTFQVTISTRNRMDHVGIYYEKLDVYVSYHNQQISLPTGLPATYQGHKDIVVWSPFIYGNSVPIAPYLGDSLTQDQSSGMVLVNVKMDGRVKWKVGGWVSGKYHLWVNCPAYITFGNRNKGVAVENSGIKYQLSTSCQVDV